MAAALIAPPAAEANTDLGPECERVYGGATFSKLIRRAWAERKYEQENPVSRRQTRRIENHRSCPRSAKAHRAMLRMAERQRKQFRAYREERLKWGSCIDEAPAASQAILDCIAAGAAHYGQSYSFMVELGRCESGLNRLAHNPSGASGLFQFMPSTWAGTPYGSQSIWSARAQALATGWMLSQGRRGEWVC